MIATNATTQPPNSNNKSTINPQPDVLEEAHKERLYWIEVKRLMDQALEKPKAFRIDWLRHECDDNQKLFSDVYSLLTGDERDTELLKASLVKALSKEEELQSTQLGVWNLMRPIGKGGMGVVWLAERREPNFNMRAAVKMLKGESISQEMVARFIRERQILANLKHPNIGHLLDGGTTKEGYPYLVMEYVSGQTIDAYCQSNKVKPWSILKMMRQLCQACAYAHRMGILHRDIKPSNILITHDGHLKLMDFGIAQDHDATSLTGGAISPMTPEYASPERFKGMPLTAAADVYAIALVMISLLTNERPKEMYPDPLKFFQKWQQKHPWVPDLTNLLQPMLERIPDFRIQDLDVIISHLDSHLEHIKDSKNKESLQEIIEYDAMVWLNPNDQSAMEQLFLRLEDEYQLHLWYEPWHMQQGSERASAMTQALARSSAILVVLGDHHPWNDPLVSKSLREIQFILKRRVIPIQLPNSPRPERETDLPDFVRHRTWMKVNSCKNDDLGPLARAIRGLAPGKPTTTNLTTRCPFPGLSSFEETDASYFFGREEMIQRILVHIDQHPMQAILGPSSCGKTSVLEAGILPQLKAMDIRIVSFSPKEHVIEECAFAMSQQLSIKHSAHHIDSQLWENTTSLTSFIQTSQDSQSSKICMIIDQFEELFTRANSKDEVEIFIENIQNALEDAPHFSVIIALRSEHLGACAQWPTLNRFIVENLDQMVPMNPDELKEAITAPAHKAGLSFEKGLAEKLIKDFSNAAGTLPILQSVLVELYERRRGQLLTAKAYTEIGGIQDALAHQAESLFQDLEPSQKKNLRRMFTLCLLSTNKDKRLARRQVTKEELLRVAQPPQKADQLLTLLIQAHLLTYRHDPNQETIVVDIAHEALIKHWSRIHEWIEADHHITKTLQQLRHSANHWNDADLDPDYLLRGRLLERMKHFVDNEANHVNSLIHLYLEESQKAQFQSQATQKKKRLLYLLGGIALGGILSLFF